LQLIPRNSSPSEGIARGNWHVTFNQETEPLRGSACRRFTDARSGFCVPSVSFTAQGWSQEDLLSLIEGFTLLDAQTWIQYDKLFLDPQPLDPQSRALIDQSIDAIRRLKQGSLYSVAERTTRVDTSRPKLSDPYHVPLELMHPDRSSQEQWIVYADGRPIRFRELTRHARSDLISARLNDSRSHSEYYLPGGAIWQRSSQQQPTGMVSAFWTGEDLLLALLGERETITARRDGERWMLEQALDMQNRNMNWYDPRYHDFGGMISWVGDLPMRTFTHRLWLDPATGLPLEAAAVYRDEQGGETEIARARLSIRPQPEPFDSSVFTMPPLPEDTIRFKIDESSEPIVDGSVFPLALPARTLFWDSDGIQRANERGRFDPDVFTPQNRSGILYRAINASWTDLERMGLVESAAYRFPDRQALITVHQGPRMLLRHMLRYQAGLTEGRDPVWAFSQQFSAVIAGAQRDVWLLETSSRHMLVFEIDDLLVQIEGPDRDTLTQRVLPALPKLEWAVVTSTR
jgi:hypothetical protein